MPQSWRKARVPGAAVSRVAVAEEGLGVRRLAEDSVFQTQPHFRTDEDADGPAPNTFFLSRTSLCLKTYLAAL